MVKNEIEMKTFPVSIFRWYIHPLKHMKHDAQNSQSYSTQVLQPIQNCYEKLVKSAMVKSTGTHNQGPF